MVKEIEGLKVGGGKDALTTTDKVERLENANKDKFDQLMNKDSTSTQATVGNDATKVSPMDLAKDRQVALNPENKLANQAQELSGRVENIKQVFNTSQLDPKQKTELQNRLGHINENLQVELTKGGFELKNIPESGSPIDRFLSFLTEGQGHINSLSTEIQALSGKKDLSPGQMLSIQHKVGEMQNKIEFFTASLNKALEGIKSLFNVQV